VRDRGRQAREHVARLVVLQIGQSAPALGEQVLEPRSSNALEAMWSSCSARLMANLKSSSISVPFDVFGVRR
jgi:hypothetical protein